MTSCPACGRSWVCRARVEVTPIEVDPLLSNLPGLPERLRYERCSACKSLIARDERRNADALSRMYEAMPSDYWDRLSDQDVFSGFLEGELVSRNVGRELWDVGSGDGTLLRKFGPRWRKHGIEPGRAGVERSRAGGLDVHAGSAASLALHDVADVVTAIDVVEHLLEPRSELAAMRAMLRPGGVLAVFTGVADAVVPRLVGRHWYYLHCTGHVTVFSARALVGLLHDVGFRKVDVLRVEHQGAMGTRRWIRRAVGNGIRAALRRPIAPFGFYRDHRLVFARV